MILDGLPPVIDDEVRVVILGSFPGVESLAKRQYYANPRNHFWLVLGEVLGVDLVSLPYEQKCKVMLKHHVGIWDAYARCEREGSLDKNIRNPVPNDFFTLRTSQLQMIFCNGQKSAKVGSVLPRDPIVLPSTSPASTMSLPEKIEAWKAIKEYL